MYRFIQYALLFLVAGLLQVFLFDNLHLSVYLAPLVYVVFVALLPLELAPVWVVLCGALTGVAMDAATGAAGVHTVATVFVAFFRRPLLGFVWEKEYAGEGGVPSERRMGLAVFLRYLGLMMLLHGAVFFYMESFSAEHLLRTTVRLAVSTPVALFFGWVLSRIFTNKLALKL